MKSIIAFWKRITFRDGPASPSYATRRARELRRQAWTDADEEVYDRYFGQGTRSN